VKFLLRLAYLTVRAKSFWQNFWTCDAFLRNSLLVSFLTIEWKERRLSVATDRNKRQKPIRTSRKALSQVTRLRLRIWSENETSICVMEIARVSRTEESASDAFQSESSFFFLHGGDCSLRIRPRRSNSESTLLCWGSEAAEIHLLSLKAKETVILCITTMHSRKRLTLFWVFRANNDSPAGHKPPYPLTGMTLGCLPILKWQKKKKIRQHWHHQTGYDEAPMWYSKGLSFKIFAIMA
jgi:hypothetical protein